MNLISYFFINEKIASLKFPEKTNEEIRKRARILFIDDEKVSQIDKLQKEGFNIEYWKDIKSLKDIERGDFDLIFLDIGGVGDKLHRDGALGILKKIKEANPSVIVIAFSGLSFDVEKNKFFKLADDVLKKDAGPIECQEYIERYLKDRFSVEYYWNKIKKSLKENEVSDDDLKKIEDKIVKAIKNKDENIFIKYVKDKISENSFKIASTIFFNLYNLYCGQ